MNKGHYISKFLGNIIRPIYVAILLGNCIIAQSIDLGQVVSKSSYAEKIYVQLNSTVFTNDETIWLKTIVTNAVDHEATTLSGNLHVELIDVDKRVIDQKLLALHNGTADTFFQLNTGFSPGRYLIRAYTEWNKNFGADFIAERYVQIYDIKKPLVETKAIQNITLSETSTDNIELSAEFFPKVISPKYKGRPKLFLNMGIAVDSLEIRKNKEGRYQFTYLLPKNVVKTKLELKFDQDGQNGNRFGTINSHEQTIVVNKNYLDLQFFPEGGELIDGLQARIGFKALDYNNKGKHVSGIIVDESDHKITGFSSNTLGMGVFGMTPKIGKTYFGKVEDESGIIYKYPLPKVNRTGYALMVQQFKEHINIRVLENQNTSDSLWVKTTSRGVGYHNFNMALHNGRFNVALEKKSLPEGIIKISICDKNEHIVSERLFFNFKKEERLLIKANTHISNYGQRDRTVLYINTFAVDSVPEYSNLSVLVLDKSALGEMQNEKDNIRSFFLLNSELKGTIESPGQYFNGHNANRYRDMDALMLTQGWRNYKYELSDSSLTFKHKPEKEIVVSGSIGEFFNAKKKSVKPIELTLMTFGKPQNVFVREVDSTGQFTFNLGKVYASDLDILLQAKTNKGQNKDYTINLDKNKSPIIYFNKEETLHVVDSINPYAEQRRAFKALEEDFLIPSNTIALDEVTITGYKMTPEREAMMKLHGPPDVVIEDKELHQKIEKWSYGLFSVLQYSYPDDIRIRRVGSAGSFLLAEVDIADFTFIIIDGIPVHIRDYRLIGNLPTKEIKSVEIIKHPKNSRKYVDEVFGDPMALDGPLTISFINIYTYSKKGLFGVEHTQGMSKQTISGYTPIREFYAPKHEDLTSEDWKVPDFRSTVYWNPNLQTDYNGNAQVEYHNADNIGEMLVIVEGITEDGKLGYHEMVYEVEEKLEK